MAAPARAQRGAVAVHVWNHPSLLAALEKTKGGVVRDPALHAEVCARIEGWIAGLPGWRMLGITESPITGPAGNHEFLIVARYAG